MQPPQMAYPSATPYTAYVPILDGVAARLRLSNAASGDGYINGVANGALVTKNMAVKSAPIEAIHHGGWSQQFTDVTEDNTGGTRRVLISYNGGALPAMVNNVIPDGWTLNLHAWAIRDYANGNVNTGFYPVSYEGYTNTPQIYFVPNFKMQVSSYTDTMNDGSDAYWTLYLSKPLNYNQTKSLVATATASWIAGNLAVSYVTNGYAQITAVKVLVPLGSQHPPQAANKVHLRVTENMHYLKGDNFVTENITHLDQDFNITVVATADTAPPLIGEARILPVASMDSSYLGEARQFNCQDQYTGHKSAVCGAFTISVKAKDAGSGVYKVECWWEGNSTSSGLFWAFTKDDGTVDANDDFILSFPDWDTYWTDSGPGLRATSLAYGHPDKFLGVGDGRFLVKVYDTQGNVASRYVDPPISGNPQNVYVVIPVPEGDLYPAGGTYNTSTGSWSAVTSVKCRVSGGAAFVSKVEFYLDNVLAATVLGTNPVANPNGYNEIACEYQGLFNVPAGSHTITAKVYDTTATAAQHIREKSWTLTVSSYTGGGGGGCVDYQAAVLLGDGTTCPAIEVGVGDEVLTRNPITGEFAIKPVGEVLMMGVQPCYRLVGTDGIEGVVSSSHRIYVPSRDAFFETKDIRLGMDVMRPDGSACVVTELEPIGERPVMTFSIHDPLNKNYWADGTLAHNMKSNDCVLPGTLITMADGTKKPIEEVKGGDQILAWNAKARRLEPDTVLTHFVTRNGQLYKVTLEDGSSVTCTGSHVLYAGGLWIAVADLLKFKASTRVRVENGDLVPLQSIEPLSVDPETEVRLIEVKNNHNLFLGGMLCHNIVKQQSETMALYVDGVYMGQVAV